MERKIADRRQAFKKSFEDPRRKREDIQVQIRKATREDHLSKRRADLLASTTSPIDSNNISSSQESENNNNFNLLSDPTLPNQTTGSSHNQNQASSNQSHWTNPNANSNAKPAFRIELLPSMVAGVMSGDATKEYECTQQFRRALSIEQNPPIQEVIESGVVPQFVKFLQYPDRPELQFEAAWALTNIASGSQEQTKIVIHNGAIPIFVELLSSPKDDVREQAVWALGNIAGDSPECRDMVLSSGGLAPLLLQLRDSEAKFTMQRNATWTLSNLCRGKPQPPFEWVQPALGTLCSLIHSSDVEVLTDACWALSYLSDGPNDRIEAVIQAGVCNRLVELLLHQSALVQTPALRTVGNIVTGDDRQTQMVISYGAIPNLLTLLSSPKKAIKKEACWTVSNITAGNREQIQEVIDNGLIPALVQLLTTSEFDIKKEAAWAISNAASGGNAKQVEFMVSCGCIKPLCDLLSLEDAKILTVALEAIENILRIGKQKQTENNLEENPYCSIIEHADGFSKLEKLQDNPNQDIYSKSWSLIYTYFHYEEAEDAEINQSTAPPGTFNFGASAPQGGFNFGGGPGNGF